MPDTEPILEMEVTVSRAPKQSIQAKLGLQLSDPKQARKDLYEFFKAYRICKQLLGRDIVEHRAKPEALPGYKNAVDPDLIHAPRVHAPMPTGWGSDSMLSLQEEKWLDFIRWIDSKVNRLLAYQHDIIRMRYLGEEPLPTDSEVFAKLYHSGWYVSERHYDEEKAKAVQLLAAALRVTTSNQ